MKKIKSIKHLKAEKKRIKHHQVELEEKIRSNWSALKQELLPVNIMKEAYAKYMNKKVEANLSGEEDVFRSTLNYGISLLAKKIGQKAGEKLDTLFKRKRQNDE